VLAKCRVGFFFALVAIVRFLSVGGATEARVTAWEPVSNKAAATGKGRLADAIKQPRAAAPCTPREIAVTVPERDA
jgi:hypothetical protein